MDTKIKQQDWTEYDKLMEELGNSWEHELPEKKVKDEIKSRILGSDVMTDSQHRYIIALFAYELGWDANKAFRFTVKVIPELKPRLSKRIARETDIQGLYQELKKNEASKLINILKSISGREKQNKSKIKS